MRRRWLLAILVSLQIAVLAGMAISNAAVGWYGQQITLKTAPVDPRDLFYGDYVVLRYEISSLDASMWTGAGQPSSKDMVYVKLRRSADEGEIYEAVAVSPERPDTAENEAVLRGQVRYAGGQEIQIRYGLERYYVPEGTGRAIEEERVNLQAHVRIAPWGQARIMELILP
ncbi:GDYXXLXY domain-containing protein [Paenibacillus daejeonensis]|uniref:GDYXXLXY domain-containing protein n=1 Tax=Paenibacillus daejeonensis TaxID=135193 RepID=UPI001FDFA26B|nr:GDYXXLXY domain-containing protein [Paenibacillus daejeonensis]